MPKKTLTTPLLLAASCSLHAQSIVPRDAQTLVPVLVRGVLPPDATSDTTGSYSAPASTIATKTAVSTMDVPQSISVITAQRIRDQNLRTTSDALAQVPSVGNAADAEGGFNIRGFSALTALNGVPSAGLLGRTAPDIAVFDRIEVLKGPAGLLSGGGAPGGVVNYVLKSPRSEPYLELTGGVGTDKATIAGLDATGALTSDKRLRGRLVAFNDSRDEYVDVEKHRRTSLYGVVDYDLAASTKLSLAYYQQVNHAVQSFRQGLPTYEDGGLLDVPQRTSLTQDWSQWRFKAHWWIADLTQQLADDWVGKISFRDGANRGPSWYASVPFFLSPDSACGDARFQGVVRGDPDGGRECLTTSFYNDVNTYRNIDAYAAGRFDLGGQSHDLVVGMNWQRNAFARQLGSADPAYDFFQDVLRPNPHVIDSPPRTAVDPADPSVSRTHGLYARATLHLNAWLQMPVGGRLTWVKEQTAGTLAKHKFSPYVGLIADIDEHWTGYVSYTTIFDTESFSRKWSPTDPNGVLLPLRSGHQYEAGVKSRWFDDRLTATAALYTLTLDDTTRQDNQHPDFSVATGQQRTRGAEFEVQGHIVEAWSLGLAYAYMDARYTKADVGMGDHVENTPRQAFNLFTNYAWRTGRLAGFSVGGGLRYAAGIKGEVPSDDLTPRVKAPGYTSVSLRAGYAVDDHLEFAVNLDNVLDRRYWQELGSVTSGNYMGAGRTGMATVRYRF